MTDTLPDQVVIISDFSNIQGGASKLALSLAQLLAAQSIPVTFFAGTAPTGYLMALFPYHYVVADCWKATNFQLRCMAFGTGMRN